MEKTKRTYRTKEERAADLDAKIEYHKKAIASLEAKKEAILSSKVRKGRLGMSSVIRLAKEKGLTPEEMLKKLGLDAE